MTAATLGAMSTSSFFPQCVEFYDEVEQRYGIPGFFDGWKGHIRLDLDFGHASAFGDALESDELANALFGERELMLGCLFALLRGHQAFGLELALRAQARFEDPVFKRLETAARRAIRLRYARLPLVAARSLGRS